MKRFIILSLFICFLVSLMIPAAAIASTNDRDPNLLWGIKFDSDINSVIEILNNRGIDTTISRQRIPLVGYKKVIDSSNDGEFNLYGYSYHLFCIISKPIEIDLNFCLHGIIDDKINAVQSICNGLAEKYGSPDYCSVDVYSNGLSSWLKHDQDGYHELVLLDSDSALSFSPILFLNDWPYTTPYTETSLCIHFYNIILEIDYGCLSATDNLTLSIRFHKFPAVKHRAKFESFTCPEPVPSSPLDSF